MLFVCRILSSTLFKTAQSGEEQLGEVRARAAGKWEEIGGGDGGKRKEGETVVDRKTFFFFRGQENKIYI